MSRDRFAEFQANLTSQDDNEDEAVVTTISHSDRDNSSFLNQVEQVQAAIDFLKESVSKVKECQDFVLAQNEPNDKAKRELDLLVSDIKRTEDEVRTKLSEMNESTNELVALKATECNTCDTVNLVDPANSAESRVQRVQHATLSMQISDVMYEYKNLMQIE